LLQMINKFAAVLLIGMASPYQILDWYGGRHTCHTASGALANHCPSFGIMCSIDVEKTGMFNATLVSGTCRRPVLREHIFCFTPAQLSGVNVYASHRCRNIGLSDINIL